VTRSRENLEAPFRTARVVRPFCPQLQHINISGRDGVLQRPRTDGLDAITTATSPCSVPLSSHEAAEGNEAHERDDDAQHEAPDNRHDDAHDHEDSAEAEAADEPPRLPRSTAMVPPFVEEHPAIPGSDIRLTSSASKDREPTG
jgi:hypothetical protein